MGFGWGYDSMYGKVCGRVSSWEYGLVFVTEYGSEYEILYGKVRAYEMGYVMAYGLVYG